MSKHPFSVLIFMVAWIFIASSCAPHTAIEPIPLVSPERSLTTPVFTEQPTETLVVATPLVIVSNLKRVVYAKHDGIWLWEVSLSPQQLTRSQGDASPKISDDGRVVAFVRDGEVWVVDVDGGNERRLSSGAGQPVFDFAPHSHTLYFQIGAGSVRVERGLLNDKLRLGRLVFSQDGRKIAVSGTDGIDVVNADGSDLKTVITFPSLNYMPEIVWLPDASGFKTVILPADPATPTRFMFVSADGKIVAKLAEFFASPATQPLISPDGAKVAYTKKQGDKLELHIIDASTADQAYFSRPVDSFEFMGWTPDSVHIVYRLHTTDELWLGPQPGQTAPLSDVGAVDHLTWVDRHSFLFVHNGELRFRTLGQPSVLLDVGLNESNVDFLVMP